MIELLLRSALLLAATALIAALAGGAGASAAIRHRIWLLGIGAVLAMPLLMAAIPSVELPILPPAEPGPAAAAPPQPFQGSPFWLILYLLIAAALTGRLLLGRVALAGAWRAALPAQDAAWVEVIAEAKSALGFEGVVHVRLAAAPVMPMTWGSIRPRILLPAEADAWPAETRRIVLLHELAHVARRDSFVQSAAALACALFWFQPIMWFALARLRAEQELAADDLVLAAGAGQRSYARELIGMAVALRGPAAGSLGMVRRSALEKRVRAILGDRPRHRPGRRFSAASSGVALLLAATVSAVLPVSAIGDSIVAQAIASPPARPAPPRALALSTVVRAPSSRLHRRVHPAPPAPPPHGARHPAPPAPPVPPIQPISRVSAVPAIPAIPALPPIPPAPAAPPSPVHHAPG